MQRFWATDGNRKCALFVFNFSSHHHINVVKSVFTSRYVQFENLRETTVLACEMSTSGCRPWLKNVACLSSLLLLLANAQNYLQDISRDVSEQWPRLLTVPYVKPGIVRKFCPTTMLEKVSYTSLHCLRLVFFKEKSNFSCKCYVCTSSCCNIGPAIAQHKTSDSFNFPRIYKWY